MTITADLTDQQWDRIRHLLPADPRRGGPWADHRPVIDAILYRSRTGCSWRQLPARYGPWHTAHNRLVRWSCDGTWETIIDALGGLAYPRAVQQQPGPQCRRGPDDGEQEREQDSQGKDTQDHQGKPPGAL